MKEEISWDGAEIPVILWEWVWKRGSAGNTTASAAAATASLESACAAWWLLQSWERGDPLRPETRN